MVLRSSHFCLSLRFSCASFLEKYHDRSAAWINEFLCKFIYVNFRMTVNLEEETGVRIDYLIPSRRFPPPDEPLLKSAA